VVRDGGTHHFRGKKEGTSAALAAWNSLPLSLQALPENYALSAGVLID